MTLHPGRQRPSFGPARMVGRLSSLHQPRHVPAVPAMLTTPLSYYQDDRYAKAGQHSPQWLDTGLGKDTAKFPSNSPTKQVGNFGMLPSPARGIFSATDAVLVYDSVHTSSFVDNELALGMRGMVVEDDYNTQNIRQTNGSQISVPHIRAPPLQGRSPYNTFPQPDLSNAYYPSKCHVNCASWSVVHFSVSQIMAGHRAYTRALGHRQCTLQSSIVRSLPCFTITVLHPGPQRRSSITPPNPSYTPVTPQC